MPNSPTSHNFIIAPVPATMIDLIWDKVEPLIKMVAAKAPDDIVPSRTKYELQQGNVLLVTISRESEIIAVNVLDVKVLDSETRVLYIPVTAGSEMEYWMEDFLILATKIAKDYNCTELRGMAVRRGWLKKLEPFGWEEMFVTIRCKIGE